MKEPMFRRAEKPKLNSDGVSFDKLGRQVTAKESEDFKKRLKEDPEAWREQE